MTRDARLYYLTYIDYKPLVELIKNHPNQNMGLCVTIFDVFSIYPSDNHHSYAILSTHADADKIIEDYGGKEAAADDLMRTNLHEHHKEPVYGNKSNLVYLNKLP